MNFKYLAVFITNGLDEGVALPRTDVHAPSGITTPEIRILPPASGQLNRYLVRPTKHCSF